MHVLSRCTWGNQLLKCSYEPFKFSECMKYSSENFINFYLFWPVSACGYSQNELNLSSSFVLVGLSSHCVILLSGGIELQSSGTGVSMKIDMFPHVYYLMWTLSDYINKTYIIWISEITSSSLPVCHHLYLDEYDLCFEMDQWIEVIQPLSVGISRFVCCKLEAYFGKYTSSVKEELPTWSPFSYFVNSWPGHVIDHIIFFISLHWYDTNLIVDPTLEENIFFACVIYQTLSNKILKMHSVNRSW